MHHYLLYILVFLSTSARAQIQTQDETPCTCPTSFAWTKTTFEENDAGFSYAIERKGRIGNGWIRTPRP